MRYVELKNCKIESTNILCPACQTALLQKINHSGSTLVHEDYKYFFICSNNECNFLGSPDSIQVPIIYDRLLSLNLTSLDFSVSAIKGYSPFSVRFKVRAFGISASEYTWDFGDGSMVTTSNLEVDHSYTIPGSYTVTLTCLNITDLKPYTCQKTDLILSTVFVTPTASFTSAPNTGKNTLITKFTDTSSGSDITKWEWDFGDGETSNEQNPVHEFKQPGKYDVSLTITNIRNQKDTIAKTNLINISLTKPVAQFTVDRSSGYTPLTVNFNYSGEGKYFPDTFKWLFGDGTTSDEKNPTHTYTTAGSYDVQLEVYNSMGSDAIIKSNIILAQSPTVV